MRVYPDDDYIGDEKNTPIVEPVEKPFPKIATVMLLASVVALIYIYTKGKK